MLTERGIEEARARRVPWDDVRERRVLAGVRAGLRHASRRRPLRLPLLAGGALAAAAAALAIVVLRPDPGPTVQTEAAEAVVGAEDPSVLRLADGTTATLLAGAHVEVAVQTAEAVELHQSSGEVRYDVVPAADRQLVVDAAGVRVRVIGTIFSVAVGHERVEVAVERGIVEVDGGEGVAELAAGHVLSVPIAGPVAAEPAVAATDPPEEPEPATALGSSRRQPGPETADARRPARPSPSLDQLLARMDEARKRRDYAEAARLLHQVIAAQPTGSARANALFTLGRVERTRRRHAAAADAFRRCWRSSPGGSLAEDARAEEATSLRDAGELKRADAAARAYLEAHPAGTHSRRMRAILKPSP